MHASFYGIQSKQDRYIHHATWGGYAQSQCEGLGRVLRRVACDSWGQSRTQTTTILNPSKASRSVKRTDTPHWTGYTRDLSMIPLEQIRKDGYDVVEKGEGLNKYFEIVKINIDKTLTDNPAPHANQNHQ